MSKRSIPPEVQRQAVEVIDRFNRMTLSGCGIRYVPRFQGAFLYLDRQENGAPRPICRLKYKGSFKNWEFSIFKYSSETYDPDEWIFPGSGLVDGTIEGAMKAGMEAYP